LPLPAPRARGDAPAADPPRRLVALRPGSTAPLTRAKIHEGHNVAGTPAGEGIINPPIDDLLKVVDSKYGLVIMASKRARQINAYYAQLGEGLLEYVGPLVETRVQEKPLSIALREISEGLIRAEKAEA
jgi:DNA-directed RNA polymerase subunit omega